MERKEIQIFIRRYGHKINKIIFLRNNGLSWNELSKATGMTINVIRYWFAKEKSQGKK